MAHWAKIKEGIVIQVTVGSNEDADQGYQWLIDNIGGDWVQTSYNTKGGIHYGPDGQPDGGTALRKNYAGVGYTYDAGRDTFIPPKPQNHESWVIDEITCLWVPPIPYPTDGKEYIWDESTISWIEINVS
jgi:hypothetical protein